MEGDQVSSPAGIGDGSQGCWKQPRPRRQKLSFPTIDVGFDVQLARTWNGSPR
jgi:hypothetical protein